MDALTKAIEAHEAWKAALAANDAAEDAVLVAVPANVKGAQLAAKRAFFRLLAAHATAVARHDRLTDAERIVFTTRTNVIV